VQLEIAALLVAPESAMRLTITAEHVEDMVKRLKAGELPMQIKDWPPEQIDALMADRKVQREIQDRASRIHALNVTLARHWQSEAWHGGFW